MKEYLWMVILIIIVVFIIVIINIVLKNRSFDITEVNIRGKWVQKCFRKYVMNTVYNEYTKKGKPTITKNGSYRADYLKDVNKKLTEIVFLKLEINKREML